jgi:hypothetical protein
MQASVESPARNARDDTPLAFEPFGLVLQVVARPFGSVAELSKAPAAVRIEITPALIEDLLAQELTPDQVYVMQASPWRASVHQVPIESSNLILDGHGVMHWACVAEDETCSMLLTSMGINPLDLLELNEYRWQQEGAMAASDQPPHVALYTGGRFDPAQRIEAPMYSDGTTLFVGAEHLGRSFLQLHDVLFPAR